MEGRHEQLAKKNFGFNKRHTGFLGPFCYCYVYHSDDVWEVRVIHRILWTHFRKICELLRGQTTHLFF